MATNGVVGIRDTRQYPIVAYYPHDFDLIETLMCLIGYKNLDELYNDLTREYNAMHHTDVPIGVDYKVAVYEATPGRIVVGGFKLDKKTIYQLVMEAKKLNYKRFLIKVARYDKMPYKGELVYIIEYRK